MSVRGATDLLDRFTADRIVVEVTHRAGRRLLGLKGMAPLGDAMRPPYRPEAGRGGGRPAQGRIAETEDFPAAPPSQLPPGRIARGDVDYGAHEETIAHLDATVRRARHELSTSADERPAQRDDGRF